MWTKSKPDSTPEMDTQIDIRYRGILKVAAPIALGSFVQFIVVFTDNFFLAKLSETHMNAAGNAGLSYVSLLMVIIGLSSGIQILVARRIGEQDFAAAYRTLRIGVQTAAIAGVLLLGVCLALYYGVFTAAIEDPELSGLMQDFFGIRMLGFLVYPAGAAVLAFYMGAARTNILLYTTLLMAVVNIALDYVLIFGHWGLPTLGIKGAAWATLIAEALALVYIGTYAQRDGYLRSCRASTCERDPKRTPNALRKQLLKVSTPIAIQQFAALTTFTIFFFLIERLGEAALNTSHIIRNMYVLMFVAMMGIGQAAKTYISTLIAERRQHDLKRTIVRLLVLNWFGWLLLSHGMWLYPETIAHLFTDDPEIVEGTVGSMKIVLVAMFLATFSSVFINVIEGAGKTGVAMAIELVATALFLTVATLITQVWPQPIQRIWMNDWLYFGFIALSSVTFLWKRPWQYHQI